MLFSPRPFSRRSLGRVIRDAAFIAAVSCPTIASPARLALQRAAESEKSISSRALLCAAKATIFRYFSAGETVNDVSRMAGELEVDGVRLIADCSTEECEGKTVAERRANLKGKFDLLNRIKSDACLERCVDFVPIKVSSFTDLDRVSENDIDEAESELASLCAAAQQMGLQLLLDAEQSHRQAAADTLALRLMKRFNVPGSKPVLYNTYQMYLKCGLQRLQSHNEACESAGSSFAAKLVRGAYLHAERQRARQLHDTTSPCFDTKDETDASYDDAVTYMLGRGANCIIATHNLKSVECAVSAMLERGISPDDPRIHFAQISGMSDHVTLKLASSNFNVHKLVLFGTFEDLFPWMLRRVEENEDVLGASREHKDALLSELRARFTLF